MQRTDKPVIKNREAAMLDEFECAIRRGCHSPAVDRGSKRAGIL